MKNKKSLKVLVLLVVSVFAVALLIGCGGNGGQQPGEYREGGTLNAGHVFDVSHPFQTGLEEFGRLINERTDGRFSVNIHSGAVLGGEVAMLEQTNAGDLDLVIATTAPAANFTQAFTELDLPFLFENHEHVYRVLDGEIGQAMFEELERTTAGLRGLVYFENGFRHMTSSVRPINVPADLQGVVFRTMENPIHLRTFGPEGFGATTIAMSFGELFIGLQQGVAEAQENPLPAIYTGKLYEVQDYLAITYHFYAAAPLIINQQLWNSLSPEDQAIFQQAALDARGMQRAAIHEMEGWILEAVEGHVQITRPDPAPWREAVIPVYDYFIEAGVISADLIQEIRELAN